jgi:putative transposase
MRYNYKSVVKSEILLQLVGQERKLMPRIGGRKLLSKIADRLPEELQLGRDSFFDFLREYGLLVRRKRYRAKTTFSNHWLRKYPNLIKEFTPDGPHQLWVSDITYVETDEGFVYLFLITDAYSRKIIGWSISDTLEAKHAICALHMALSQLPVRITDVYHHSDRGVQYCCDKYVKVLQKNHFQISMTDNGDPLENAIAERVNGILKTEWIYDMKLKTKLKAKEEVSKIINIYNNHRPHCSIDMFTPDQAHCQSGSLKKHWKNYWKSKETVSKDEKSLVL